MPIPQRKSNETKSDFISRCMADGVMLKEYPDESQRMAVCRNHLDRNLVEISGVIVDSRYDDEWFQEYIAKGLLTPLSKIKRDLAAADTDKPLMVRINSGGGSVFSAYEMLNEIVRWRNENGHSVRVEVGAMAASAASMIAIMLGPVSAHENSMFMFHGATSGTEGGAQSMADTADLLGKINARMMETLVSKYNLDPDVVKEWFAEGRMGWLTAEEARSFGIVDIVIPASADAIEYNNNSIDAMQSRGLQVAALLEYGDDEMKIMDAITAFLGIDQNATDEEVALAIEKIESDQQRKQDEAYDEGLNANVENQVAEKTKAIVAECGEKVAEAEAAKALAEKEKTEAVNSMAEMKSTLEKAEARLAQLDKGFQSDGDSEPDDYWAAVESNISAGMSKNAAMLKAQREHPDLHREMLEQNR